MASLLATGLRDSMQCVYPSGTGLSSQRYLNSQQLLIIFPPTRIECPNRYEHQLDLHPVCPNSGSDQNKTATKCYLLLPGPVPGMIIRIGQTLAGAVSVSRILIHEFQMRLQ